MIVYSYRDIVKGIYIYNNYINYTIIIAIDGSIYTCIYTYQPWYTYIRRHGSDIYVGMVYIYASTGKLNLMGCSWAAWASQLHHAGLSTCVIIYS